MIRQLFYNLLRRLCRKLSNKFDALSLSYFWKLQFGAEKYRKAVASSVVLKLNKREKREIKKHWGGGHLFWFKWYKKVCIIRQGNDRTDFSDVIWKYIPDDIYFKVICPYFSDFKACNAIDDKNLYDLYFHDIAQPITLFRKINGILLDKDYVPLDYVNAIQLIRKQGKAVVKKAKASSGGKGVVFFDDSILDKELLHFLEEHNDYIVQECIRQHPVLNAIHEESINTLRIMTFFYKGKLIVLSTVLRVGRGKSKVDNSSSGGLFCGVDEKGVLRKYGFDKKMNFFTAHPNTGVRFEGIALPGYDTCKELVIKLAFRFLNMSQLISWDLAIDEEGMPILIEPNLMCGDIDFHQIANGPLFGMMTEDVLKGVFDPE